MPIEWWHETYSNMVDEARRSTNQDQRMKLSLTLPRQWLTTRSIAPLTTCSAGGKMKQYCPLQYGHLIYIYSLGRFSALYLFQNEREND
jgi:hypothetical protein